MAAALDVKAEDVVALDVKELSSFADVFVVASGRSDRQVRAIADSIEAAAKQAGAPPLGIEGHAEGHWVLIDLDDVIVHVFTPETRERYAIERLWSDAQATEGSAQPASDRRERAASGTRAKPIGPEGERSPSGRSTREQS